MERLIKKANKKQLEKLWTACYDLTRVCYEIGNATDTRKRLELRLDNEIIYKMELLLMKIMQEELNRERGAK